MWCFETSKANIANHVERGIASWYSIKCNGGTQTASGKKLNDSANMAAHKTLPMGTMVKITNLNNGKHIICPIFDRGPYITGRIIDVTISVAETLGFKSRGITKVKLEVVGKVK